MQAIFIPHALYMAFFHEGRSAQDFLKLDSLANTLSLEDVAFYMACNLKPELTVPQAVCNSFEFINFKSKLSTIDDVEQRQALETYLLKFQDKEVTEILKNEKTKMLTCDILDGDVILFSYIDAPENASQSPDVVDFYDRLLNQVTASHQFHEVAKLSIMGAYLKAQQDVIFS